MRLQDLKQLLRNERLWSFVFWFAILVAVDQFAKYAAFILIIEPVYVSFNKYSIVGFEQFQNYYFAFSLPIAQPIIFLIYGVVLAIIIHHVCKSFQHFSKPQLLAWTLILSGALSNVIERVVNGYVKDFVYVIGGGIFNFADFYILVGIVLLLVSERHRQKI